MASRWIRAMGGELVNLDHVVEIDTYDYGLLSTGSRSWRVRACWASMSGEGVNWTYLAEFDSKEAAQGWLQGLYAELFSMWEGLKAIGVSRMPRRKPGEEAEHG